MFGNISNFGLVTLAADITAGALTLNLTSGDAVNIPPAPFYLVFWNSATFANPASTSTREILLVEAAAGVALSGISRAQEGTSAMAWTAGTKGLVVPVKSMWDRIKLIVDDKDNFRFNAANGKPQFNINGTWYYLKPVEVAGELIARFSTTP